MDLIGVAHSADPGIPWGSPGVPRGPLGHLGFPRAPQGSKSSRAPQSSQGCPGLPKASPGLPRAPQTFPGLARSSRGLPRSFQDSPDLEEAPKPSKIPSIIHVERPQYPLAKNCTQNPKSLTCPLLGGILVNLGARAALNPKRE